jgi:ABC-type multidrug transport system fused ATPase/permease subunit
MGVVEVTSGRILDGNDITKFSAKKISSKIAIIPQEPHVFKGTIRFNLDPLGAKTDTELKSALERVGLGY